jgi:hypothetical protein
MKRQPLFWSPFDSPEVQASCEAIRKASVEHHYPLVLTESQMFLVNYVVALALDDLPRALRTEPGAKRDIKRDEATYNAILSALRQAKAARAGHGGANEDWRNREDAL